MPARLSSRTYARNLSPVVAHLRLYLAYPLLGGLHLKEAHLLLQPGDIFSSGCAELTRHKLHARHGVEEDHDVLDVDPYCCPCCIAGMTQ